MVEVVSCLERDGRPVSRDLRWILSVALRGEPTGAPLAFRGDVVAVAKRDLRPGDTLDGEGGFTGASFCRRGQCSSKGSADWLRAWS
jgi:predicted homoserine dehydrogenase-like protein